MLIKTFAKKTMIKLFAEQRSEVQLLKKKKLATEKNK